MVNFLVITSAKTGQLLCYHYYIALHRFDYTNKKIRIGYVLNKNYHRQKIMQNSMIKLIVKIFAYSTVERIEASVNTENISSIKLLEKINFVKEGVLRKYSYNPRTKQIEDRIIFSIISADINKII